jgi:hypothetical protein
MRPTLVLAGWLLAGCGRPAVPEPPAPIATPTVARRPHPPPPAEVCRCMTMCIVRNGWLQEIPVRYNFRTGDTLTVDSLPISQVAPLTGEYASVAGWYVANEAITFRGHRYVKYGVPLVMGVREVARIGEYQKVGVYAERADTASVSRVFYLPSRPGCEFQPYAADTTR